MKSAGKLIFLGTGGSMGIPVVACSCEVCLSKSPHNKRFRSSVLCQIGKKNILIDCGPDFREQALQHKIEHIDGVILTHAHNDHTAGIDELRVYCLRTGKPLPCLLSPETAADLKTRFHYLFEQKEPYAGLMTRFAMHFLEADKGEIAFQGIQIRYFAYEQLHMRVYGFRFGDVAYVSDIKDYPPAIFEDLKGLRTLVLSALRMQPSYMHFSVDEAIAFAQRVGAEKTWFMHVAHELDHDKGNAYLPENMRLAYDGLQLDFQADIVG